MTTRGAAALALGTFAAAVLGVAATQPRLAAIAHEIKDRDDVYALPPAAEMRVATFGWDAAAVDLLWTKLLAEYGTHWSEHREFLGVPRYVDAILELEPTFRPLYRIVDTLLAYRPLQGTEDDVRRARAYLERGLRERPDDPTIWLEYGQFLAFVAPSFLTDDAERGAFRLAGAEAIGHAVEVGADAERALSAATMLTRSGARDQAIHFLERAYAFTEQPGMADVHDAIGQRLSELEGNAMREAADKMLRAVDGRWQHELPFVPRDMYLLLGPQIDPLECAGPERADRSECERDWKAVLGPQ